MSHIKNRKCYAPSCKGNYGSTERVSLFRAPRNPDIRKKWNTVIPRADRDLQERDVLCEKHFDPNDIKRSITINKINIPYKRPRLKEGAMPKFITDPLYLTKRIRKKSILIKIEDQDADVHCDNTTISEAFILTPKKIIAEDFDFFSKLYVKDEILNLIERWGIFTGEENNMKYILYSQMTVKNNLPVMAKQIILFSNLELKFYFGTNQITYNVPTSITSIENLEIAINSFSNFIFCCGGPSAELNENVVVDIAECASIDYTSGSWRHEDCAIFLTSENSWNSTVCANCNSLWSRLHIKFEELNHQ